MNTTTVRFRIMDLLAREGGLPVEDIERRLGIGRHDASRWRRLFGARTETLLASYEKAGILQREGSRWLVTIRVYAIFRARRRAA